MTIRARVRGIYSTALSKILHENGIVLVDVSDVIAERLGIDKRRGEAADVTVKSDEDEPSQVLILGFPDQVDEITKILEENIPQTIVYRPKIGLYSAFKTRIVNKIGRECIAETPIGTATLVDEPECIPGKEVYVTVIKVPIKPGEKMVLSSRVRVIGHYAIVGRGARVSFSSYIRNKDRISELLNISSKYVREGYSIRWRSNADEAPLDKIESEIPKLIEKLKDVEEKLQKSNTLDIVYIGEHMAIVEMTYQSKKFLDDLRNDIVPTSPYHHMLRCIENMVEGVVDLVDIVSKYTNRNDLAHWLREWLIVRLKASKDIRLRHKQPLAKNLILGAANIQNVSLGNNGVNLVLRRRIRGGGRYDGLNLRKEFGDYALTEVSERKWFIIHKYYSANNELKGTYVNINTPPEFLPSGTISYIDLGVDIIIKDGKCKLIDTNDYRKLITEGIVSHDIIQESLKAIEEVLRKLCS
jgi:hypothetical protein